MLLMSHSDIIVMNIDYYYQQRFTDRHIWIKNLKTIKCHMTSSKQIFGFAPFKLEILDLEEFQ